MKKEVKFYYENYSGAVYLFRSKWLLSTNYELKKISATDLRYFRNLDAALTQSKKSKLKWIAFFEKKHV